ncbi:MULTISPECIES: VOC family protein [Xanthobacter]|uniref:Glyoxalase/bleomycin resistance protein/dioxygenase n=1 Tax=Xanthobacter autotrophicus (strain ATCC BAA-1158 / Py2) TaxID=78245 RepID=A7IN14_XANP2|nr:VOC family protein [Xanthobacter autotrophicus]ABS69407.1 Glyoxalase/bleomycin resistance protein/dioxygenase [Xanthobacter autotrophicus Py2]MDI4664558.1 VOC family protein [Xanthobacter autotrophicus]
MSDTAETTTPTADFSAMPPVKGGVTAYLTVDGAMKAVEFYKSALGAELAFAIPPDDSGRTMHVHLYINGSSVMLADPYPEYCAGPVEKLGGFNLSLHVTDTDAAFERAVAAGASVMMPPSDMFWGARYAQVRDPFGVVWAFNQPH